MDCHKIAWTQPYGLTYLLARTKGGHLAWREFQIWTLAWALNFLVFWLIACLRAKYDPDIRPMSLLSALAFSLQGGLMVACAYQLHWLAPSGVVLNDEGISIVGANAQRWPYEQIAAVRFRSLRVGEREFRLMVVSPREGREATFGLSDEVNLRQITDPLVAKGVEVSEL
jgi:hypothetical protein